MKTGCVGSQCEPGDKVYLALVCIANLVIYFDLALFCIANLVGNCEVALVCMSNLRNRMALHAPEQDAYTLQDLEPITETDVSSESASTVSSQTPVSSSRSCCTHRSEQAVKEAENLRIKYEAWSQNELDQSAQQMQEADESTETESSLASGSESSNDIDPQYLRVRAAPKPTTMTEQDELKQCAEKLAVHLRSRPTLPARYDNLSESFQDVSSGI